MKELPFLNLSPVYLELGHTTLKALRDERGLELPLERAENGRLTAACKEKIVSSFKQFLNLKSWQPRARAFCAIAANGVSLRRVSLPAGAKEDLERLLLLQIEAEFPLAPDQLAWGYRHIGNVAANGSPARQELLVGAVKKEVVEEYAQLLLACGLNPVFTVAALARSALCPEPLDGCAIVELENSRAELVTFQRNAPDTVRVLSWSADDAGLDTLASMIARDWNGTRLYLSGAAENLPPQLAERLGGKIVCEQLKVISGEGRSAAVLGLKKGAENFNGLQPLVLATKSKAAGQPFSFSEPVPKKLAAIAATLAIAWLLMPYAEAVLFKGHLEKKLAAMKKDTAQLPVIDRELDFLQSLKQNQPPYLDALYLFSKSAAQGTRFESLTMNRRGEVSIRGSMRDGQQVADFRSKLINSGLFSNVTVEEQSPTPDRQKVNIRMTAQWKPYLGRAGLSIGPSAEEIEKAKTAKPASGSSGPPAGMPPGRPLNRPAPPSPKS